MPALFVLGITAFLFCLITTPLCRDAFIRAGLVDKPDKDRKFHLRAVPRMGGVPIAISYAGALAVVFFFNLGPGKMYIQHEHLFHALLPAALIIFATGLLDDIYSLKPWQKLLGQFVGATLAVSLGARLSLTHFPAWVSIVLSIGWLLSCTNAVNLIDGMDGLATGVGLLATLTTLFVALLSGNIGLALATVPLAGCLLAFLCFNFNPASVFLGDCGSLTIGFILGCFGLIWSQHTGTMLGMVAPLMAFSLPLIDVVLAIARRFLRNVPITKGDRGHIHHMVLNLGFSTRRATLVLYAVCCLSASLAVLESFSGKNLVGPIIVLFLSLVLIGVKQLGYVEFSAFRKTLSHTTMRRAVQDEIYLEELSRSLTEADDVDQWWSIIRTTCNDMRFASAHLEYDGRSYDEVFVASSEKPTCRIQLGFGDSGHLVLTRLPEKAPPRIMMAVLNHVQSSITQKTNMVAQSRLGTSVSIA